MAGDGEAPGRPNSDEDGSPPVRARGGRAREVCGLPCGSGLGARGYGWAFGLPEKFGSGISGFENFGF